MSFFARVANAVNVKIPERVLFYSQTGCGKTSAACSFPNPVVMPCELGLDAIPTVERLPQPKTWKDAMAMMDELIKGAGRLPFQTFVIDTADALERLCWAHVCAGNNFQLRRWKSIQTPGYGKGYDEAHKVWINEFFPKLDLIHEKGFNVVICAQSMVKTWTNPNGENFDRYQLRLHDKVATVFQEWVADQFFCRHYTGVTVRKSEVTGRVVAKGVSTNTRIAHTVWDAAWNAKHRLRVPEEIAMPDPLTGSFYDTLQRARSGDLTTSPTRKEETQEESAPDGDSSDETPDEPAGD